MFTSALRRAIYKNYKPYKYAKDVGMGEWMTIATVVTPSTLVKSVIKINLNKIDQPLYRPSWRPLIGKHA